MPALAPVPKVLKTVVTVSDQNDTRSGNRCYLQYSGTQPSLLQLQTFTTALLTAFGTRFASLYDTHTIFESVECTDLTSPTAPQATATGGTNGSRTGLGLAAGTALVLDFPILRRYRGGKPKAFLSCGIASDMNTRQLWGSTFANSVASAWISWILDASSAIWTGGGALQQVNISYFEGFTNHTYPSGRTRPIPTPRGTPLVDTIVSVVPNLKVGSQRRRNLQSA